MLDGGGMQNGVGSSGGSDDCFVVVWRGKGGWGGAECQLKLALYTVGKINKINMC